MALTEYIYVNTPRLDAYFEQISSPLAYDKIPTISVSLSLVGPKAGAVQSRNARAFTTHEKITKLVKYLREHDQLLDNVPFAEASDNKPFVMHDLHANRVFIPPITDRAGVPDWFKGLGLWISNPTETYQGRVYLLEDLRQADREIEFISAYSSLNMLRQEFLILSDLSIAGGVLNGRTSSVEHESEVSFSANPLEFLARLGAHLNPEARHITTLYRLRAHFYEESGSETEKKWKPTIVGYPVFISSI